MDKLLRYADLVELGLFNNRNTLKNWVRLRGFPPGRLVGPNTRMWTESEVKEFIATRLTAAKWHVWARKPTGGYLRKTKSGEAPEQRPPSNLFPNR